MKVFDSADVDPADRVDACDEMIRTFTAPCDIVHEKPGPDVQMRLDVTRYGPVSVVCGSGTGVQVTRTPRHLREITRPTVSIAIQTSGQAHHEWGGTMTQLKASDAVLIDGTRSQSYGWTGHGAVRTLVAESSAIALPPDVIRTAVPLAPMSPLTPLLVHHAGVLAGEAGPIARQGPGVQALGHATLDLMRALIMSVVEDSALRRSVARQTLLERVLAYTHLHLADPDLNAERIAAAHFVSPRTVFRVCAEAGISLEQEIIDGRLRAVRRALEDPANRHRTIDAIARSQGFQNITFFNRRFRLAFGTTPREWRNLPALVPV
ncbi:AraC family transcriptional regulator [Streptomyces sp. NPDC014861]|uniref:AraC family transcriptional regulator n=1 Tax=Streptomyces sp. NPDC014861 TaxID=3364923 RepID=UPI0037035C2D